MLAWQKISREILVSQLPQQAALRYHKLPLPRQGLGSDHHMEFVSTVAYQSKIIRTLSSRWEMGSDCFFILMPAGVAFRLLGRWPLVPVLVEDTEIPPHLKVHEVTREQRRVLLHHLKHFSVEIAGPCPVTDAIVTSGGVKTKEIDPTTMESKLVKGLYFAGELIDVDAYTGGFNLQIAWATGRAAGLSASENEEQE